MTKRLDPALKGLKMADKGIRNTPKEMRMANLKYLWDKYIVHPPDENIPQLKLKMTDRKS